MCDLISLHSTSQFVITYGACLSTGEPALPVAPPSTREIASLVDAKDAVEPKCGRVLVVVVVVVVVEELAEQPLQQPPRLAQHALLLLSGRRLAALLLGQPPEAVRLQKSLLERSGLARLGDRPPRRLLWRRCRPPSGASGPITGPVGGEGARGPLGGPAISPSSAAGAAAAAAAVASTGDVGAGGASDGSSDVDSDRAAAS